MQNGLIQNDQINASSYNRTGYESWRARLYGDRAWWMALGDAERWLQVDFRSRAPRVVTGIQTQGLWGGWVTSYTVSYSNDSLDWSMYGGGQILTGNTNGRNDTVQHDFTPPLVTRYLRVNVRTWHDQIARLRMELLGCDGIDNCTPEPCANGATCYDELDTYTCACAPGFTGDKCTIGEGLSAGAIVGIVLGILCFLLMVGILLVYCFKKRLRPSARIQAEVSREAGNEHANDANHRNGGKTPSDHGDDLETATD
ncbi:retinoschisin-like [Branchiostoma floridae x Branchiostoma belcheri]